MSYFERELPPEELLKHPAWESFRNFGVQWSQLVALLWIGDPDLEGGLKLTDSEKDLRTHFINLLQKQAKHTELYVKCDTPGFVLTLAEEASKEIKDLLLGNKKIGEITLSDVLKKYTTQDLMTTVNEDVKKMFAKMFNVRVITESFVGKITYARGKDASSPDEDKYILELTYPPRPVFSDATITEKVLHGWANRTTLVSSYEVPPSVYIPGAVC